MAYLEERNKKKHIDYDASGLQPENKHRLCAIVPIPSWFEIPIFSYYHLQYGQYRHCKDPIMHFNEITFMRRIELSNTAASQNNSILVSTDEKLYMGVCRNCTANQRETK